MARGGIVGRTEEAASLMETTVTDYGRFVRAETATGRRHHGGPNVGNGLTFGA